MSRRLTLLLAAALLALVACKPEIGAIELSPAEIVLAPGESADIKAAVFDEKGQPLAGTLDKPIGIDLRYSSSSDAVASVEALAVERQWVPEAKVSARSAGEATIHASFGAVRSKPVRVVVRAPQGQ